MTDQERLQLFLRKVGELQKTTLVRDGYESGFTLKWSADTGVLSFQAQQPNEESFKALLLCLRHFWLKKEPTYIYSIYNTCHRVLTNDTHKKFLAKSRSFLDKSLKSTGIHLNIDERHYSPEYVWDIYINGLYFHSDSEKMKSIDSLNDHERMLVKNELYGFVNSLCKQVLYVGRVVAHAFDHNEIAPSNQGVQGTPAGASAPDAYRYNRKG